MPSQTPDLTEVLEAAHTRFMQQFFTAIPGIVKSFNASNRIADVQPAVMWAYDGDDGARQVEDLPVVHAPVVYPGGGDFEVTFPVKPGDEVLLVVSSLPITSWLLLGRVVDPKVYWRNHLSEALAIPGLRSFRDLNDRLVAPIAADTMLVSAPAGGKVKLGATSREARDGGTSAVALRSGVEAALKGALTNSSIISGILAFGADGGASLTTAVNAYFAAHPVVGAQRVEAL